MSSPSAPSRTLWIVVSILFVLGSPLLALGAGLLAHAASFQGTCGPYAPDIPEHACDFATYLANFFSPFAVMGMMVLAPVVLAAAALLTLGAWALALTVAAVRARR